MANHDTHPDAISAEAMRQRAIASTIWARSEPAIVRLHNQRNGWEAIEVAARVYIMHVVNQAQQGAEAPPEAEFKRRLILRDLTKLLHEKLAINEREAMVQGSLFCDRINTAIVEATGDKPRTVIEAGAQLAKRPLKQVGQGDVRLSSRERDLLLRILLPQSIVEDYWQDLPNLRDIFGPILDLVEPLKNQLSAVSGDNYYKLRDEQLSMIRQVYPSENRDVIPLIHTLYQVQVAAEGVIKALRQEADCSSKGEVANLAGHQLKPACRELVTVLTRVSNWDKSRAEMAASEFTSELRKLMAYDARFPSTEGSVSR